MTRGRTGMRTVPDTLLSPSGSSAVKLRKLCEEDISGRSGMRCSGDVSIPGRLPMDRKMTRGGRREVRRKSSTRTNRLDSPMPSKPALITDYYTRAPAKRRRMMSGDEKLGFDDMDGWEDVTQQYLDKSTQGVVVDKAKPEEDDIVDWPGTEEDIEEWTVVALSFLEESGCDTPVKGRGTVEDSTVVVGNRCSITLPSTPAGLHQLTTVADVVGTRGNFTGPHETPAGQQPDGPGTVQDGGVVALGMVKDDLGVVNDGGATEMIDVITDEVKNLSIPVVDSTRALHHQHTVTAAGTDSNLSILCRDRLGQSKDDQACMEGAKSVGVDAGTVDGAHGVSVVVDGQTNTDVVGDSGVVGDRVSFKTLLNTTHTHTQHPTMVKRGVVDSMEDGDVLCVYTDGVCATHGPATKKWRGGRVWGQKKNGLFGWKYDRKTYWKCEKKRVDIPEVENSTDDPTFILMGVSKDRLTQSRARTTGGKGKRLGDSGNGARTRDSGL